MAVFFMSNYSGADGLLQLQEKKRALALAALSGDKLKNMKLGMDDLLALFRRDDDGDW
jgi:hypothetical protein